MLKEKPNKESILLRHRYHANQRSNQGHYNDDETALYNRDYNKGQSMIAIKDLLKQNQNVLAKESENA